jgi:hypothetical protein
MVVEVLGAQRQGVDPLGDQVRDGVLDEVGGAVVGEAGGELAEDPGELLGLRSSSTPPSEVMSPPSKSASTWRDPSKGKSR